MQTITSKCTAVHSIPALFKRTLWIPDTLNLDIGGGPWDDVTRYLKRFRVTNYVLDPYNRSDEHDQGVRKIFGQFHSVTCCNVLNVIDDLAARQNIYGEACDALGHSSTPLPIYFQIYEGDKSGKGCVTSKGFQHNKKTEFFQKEIESYFHIKCIRVENIIIANIG